MSSIREWLGDTQQQVMTQLVNRTCKRDPNMLDRLATRVLTRVVGVAPHDPELDHPEPDQSRSVASPAGSSHTTN